jgi:uncharacterized protein
MSAVTSALVREDVLVADIDLWKVTTKEKLAGALAAAIYSDIARPRDRAMERALAPFRGLRITPTVTVDPNTGAISFRFNTGAANQDIDQTLERLLELPAELAAEQGKPAVLVFDEFQEVSRIDKDLTKLMRSVFQQQADVSHIYLGSKRHLMEEIFGNADEPFWRSAKQVELGPIPKAPFGDFITKRFADTGKDIEKAVVDRVLQSTGGHPYATQRLCYEIWQRTDAGWAATEEEYGAAFESVLNSEDARFALIWDESAGAQKQMLEALAKDPGRPLRQDYRDRHSLPSAGTVQRAVGALRQRELIGNGNSEPFRVIEPFFAEWLLQNVVGSAVEPDDEESTAA